MHTRTILNFCCAVAAAALMLPLRADPLSAAQRKDDPTLSRRVTLVAHRAYIGDLLEQASLRSGVPLSADMPDGAGDILVTASLHDVPLADAMDALWSLVSYKSAEWDWSRTGQAGHYQYRLKRTDAARAFAAQLKQQVQSDFETQTATLVSALRLSPDERHKRAKALQGQDDGTAALMADDGVCAGLSVFADALSPEVQAQVLKGEAQPSLSISGLSPGARSYVHSLWTQGAWKKMHQDGTWDWAPEPTQATVYAKRYDPGMTPSLEVEFGYMGSLGYSGGTLLDRVEQKKLIALWMLPGDADSDARTTRAVSPRPPHPADAGDPPKMAGHVLDLGRDAPLSVIARLPDEQTSGSSADNVSPEGRTVAGFLDALQDQAHLKYKWRDGILLMMDPAWMMHDEAKTAPWTALKELRDAEVAAPDGYLPLTAMMHVTREYSREQVSSLSEFFPIAPTLAHFYDILAQMEQSPSLPPYILSPHGSTRTDAMEATNSVLYDDKKIDDGTVKHIRLVQTQYAGPTPRREFMFTLLDKDDRMVDGQGFSVGPHQYRSGVEGEVFSSKK